MFICHQALVGVGFNVIHVNIQGFSRIFTYMSEPSMSGFISRPHCGFLISMP